MSAMKILMETIYYLYLEGYSVIEIAKEVNVDTFAVIQAIDTMEGNEEES